MENVFCTSKAYRPVQVLIYGGHNNTIKKLDAICPPGIRLHFISSTRHSISHLGFVNYDLVYAFVTNISHGSCADVRSAARKRDIPFRVFHASGAESALAEILDSIALRGKAS